MHLKPKTLRQRRPRGNAGKFRRGRNVAAIPQSVAPGAGVDLDHRGAHLGGRLDLRVSGAMKSETRIPAGLRSATTAAICAACPATSSPPSVVRSSRRSGTMQAACGRVLMAIATISARRRHFQIERLGDARLQPRDIVIADVTSILAQMRRDPVGAGRDRDLGRAQRIGMIAAAGVAHRRDVIDVDAKANGMKPNVIVRPRR